MKQCPHFFFAILVGTVCHAGCGTGSSPNEELPIAGATTWTGAAASGTSTTTPGAGGAITAIAAGKGGSSGKGGAAGSASKAGRGGSMVKAGAGGGGKAGASTGGKGGAGGDVGPEDTGGCPTTAPSNCEVVSATIVIAAGETRDYQCKCFQADPFTLGDGSQAEGQSPVFILRNGAKLLNVVLGSPAADGIHIEGNATLQNVVWTDIGEDAMTIKEPGTVILDGGYAANGDDKIFQINAESTFKVSNFKASRAGKFIRQNGNTLFKIVVEIDKCDISNMYEAVFRTDSSSSTVKMTNTLYSGIGKQLFIVPSSSQVTQSNNVQY
jgi:pectate lyase C